MTSIQASYRYDGLDIQYGWFGPSTGTPVILIHGFGSSRRMWKSTIDSLVGWGYRCLALDLPGHGDSAKPGHAWYSIDRFADVIARLRADLAIDRPVVLGHSMGGTIALKLSALEPHALRQLIVINPVISGAPGLNGTRWNPTLANTLLSVTRTLWPIAVKLMRYPPVSLFVRRPRHVLRQLEDMGRTTADSALGSIRAVLREDLTDSLNQIRVPTVVFVGLRDSTVPPAEGRKLARAVASAELFELPAGHHPYDEVPDQFFRTLSRCLAHESVVEA